MKILALVALAVLTIATAPDPLAEARKAIDAGNDAYIVALKNADAHAMAQLFAPDGAVMSERGPVTEGRDNVEKLWAKGMVGPPVITGTITTLGIEMDGDTAYERGRYSFTSKDGTKPAETDTGTYFTIWKKQADGSWKIRVDAGFPAEPVKPAAPGS